MLSIIVAQSQNRVIGRDNKLPWRLPNDLQYFKRMTMGKPVIMGRKTFAEDIGRPLPGRTNIVVTRNSEFSYEGVVCVPSVEAAIEYAEDINLINGVEEAMVIGGGEIYRQALALAERLYITQVHAEVEGNVYFPELDYGDYQEIAREDFSASGDNPYDYSFVVYQRVES